MIIKKHQAQAPLKLAPVPEVTTMPSTRPHLPEPVQDPYLGALTPDMFASGLLPERRKVGEKRTERRKNYRRLEDMELITEAQQEANAIRERAEEEGFQAGLAAGQSIIDELSGVIHAFYEARQDALLSASDTLADMAIAIAENILKTEVMCDEALVVSLVKSTIAKVGQEQKRIVVKVHPMDFKTVQETFERNRLLPVSVELQVLEDSTVDTGSCIVESQAGQIDARFSTQLEVLKRILTTGERR